MAGREDDRDGDHRPPGEPWQPRTRSERRAAERAAERAAQRPGPAEHGHEGPPTTQLPRLSRRAPGPDPRPASWFDPRPGDAAPAPPEPFEDEDEDADDEPRRLSRRWTVLLVLAALALDGWAALCFIDTGEPALVALTALAPALSVLCLPVLAIAVARRSALAALLSLAAAVVPWVLVAGSAVAGPGPTSAVTGQPVLRVMTVDAGAGRASAAAIVRATRDYGVDVLVVTQLSSRLAHDLTVAGLPSAVAPRWVSIPDGPGLGAGLWSKQPAGPTSAVPGFSQPATRTTLTTPSGEVTLVVAHAGGAAVVPDRQWRSDLRALGAAPVSGPRILAGDLGGTVWHPAFRRLTSHGWSEAADVLGQGLRPTWPAWSPVPFVPLDQVLVGGGVGVSRADTITIAGTTHRALLVTAVLPAG